MYPYHFAECGLPNVRLNNGFTLAGEGEEQTVSITAIDNLHRAIGYRLTSASYHFGLTAPEIKFLRTELGLTPEQLANLIGVHEWCVNEWEAGKKDILHPEEALLRILYREKFGCKVRVMEYLTEFSQRFRKLDILQTQA
ncbi:MAG: hypothetical protein EON60_14300, partial [Alphaproteobacteria bacterium]